MGKIKPIFSGFGGYLVYIAIFTFFFMTLASFSLVNVTEVYDTMQQSNSNLVTGAVTSNGEVQATEGLPLINWAVILITFSFLVSMLTAKGIAKASRYRT